jgi:hypothetical protein
VLILDTDHLAEYQKGTSAEARRLKERLEQADESFGTTIITVEEVMRGCSPQSVERRIPSVKSAPMPGCGSSFAFSLLGMFSNGPIKLRQNLPSSKPREFASARWT